MSSTRVIKLLVEKELLNPDFARNLLSWRHSGFSIDNSIRILDESAQENLAEYIARPPISLAKIRYEPFKGRVLFHTTYSEYFKENLHMFDALDFIAELTEHIPPKGLQLIRRYGLYASRTKGRWEDMPWVSERAPEGWKCSHLNVDPPGGDESISFPEDEVEVDILAYKQHGHGSFQRYTKSILWLAPSEGLEMKVIAVIEKPGRDKTNPPASGEDRQVSSWFGFLSTKLIDCSSPSVRHVRPCYSYIFGHGHHLPGKRCLNLTLQHRDMHKSTCVGFIYGHFRPKSPSNHRFLSAPGDNFSY